MNELEKAQALISNRNYSLKELSKKCKYSTYGTLRHDRVDPKKMEEASWKRIHELAGIYDIKRGTKMDYKKLADELNEATENDNIDKVDSLSVVEDDNCPSGYRVDIYWRAGTDGDGNNSIDLGDIFFENLDNPKIDSVLNKK